MEAFLIPLQKIKSTRLIGRIELKVFTGKRFTGYRTFENNALWFVWRRSDLDKIMSTNQALVTEYTQLTKHVDFYFYFLLSGLSFFSIFLKPLKSVVLGIIP